MFFALDSSTGSTLTARLGLPGDAPIPDPYLGEGTANFAIFRPSTATFYILDPSTGIVTPRPWGMVGDQPHLKRWARSSHRDHPVHAPGDLGTARSSALTREVMHL